MDQPKNNLKLLIVLASALIYGALLGFLANETVIQVVLSIKHICGQVVFYTVPLIIIGFMTPSIIRMGRHATKIILAVLGFSYLSSVGAALFAMVLGYLAIPVFQLSGGQNLIAPAPELLFSLDIPQIMPVISAVLTATFLGLGVLWTGAENLEKLSYEFEKIVINILRRVIIPILPVFAATTAAVVTYSGNLSVKFPIFIKLTLIIIAGHFVWLFVLYLTAMLISKRNPLEVVRHYLPAYLTAMGTMSSLATIPVSLAVARKSTVLSKSTVDFVIPMAANSHVCGSALTEIVFCMAIYVLQFNAMPAVDTMILFCLLLGLSSIGAPGIPGGTVVASLGVVSMVLGFNRESIALLLTVFALQDSFGTACNVTADGAMALIVDGVFNPKAENLQVPGSQA